MQHRCQEIGALKSRVIMTKERLAAENQLRVQRQKEETIQHEIKLINQKQHEARRLEKHETKIINRLRETHTKQQETIAEIASIIAARTPIKEVVMPEESF